MKAWMKRLVERIKSEHPISCSKCGGCDLKGYPQSSPIEYVCLDCGEWMKI